MTVDRTSTARPGRPTGRPASKETTIEQISSFVSFFIYLLVLKSFLVPLFVIPTGSMAETLRGAHAVHTCPNCGMEYAVGLPTRGNRPQPPVVQCPNCRWQELVGSARELQELRRRGVGVDGVLSRPLHRRAGDRIMVHGWPYVLGNEIFQPRRWDVVVFKVPSDGQTNYIKRLIGLPGETVEIIGGDVFITDPQTHQTRIARKSPQAQRSLWFPYYNHDYPPREPAAGGSYFPRWIPLTENTGWLALETRRPRFDYQAGGAGAIQFVTDPVRTPRPGRVEDVYGYNGPREPHTVTDVRLGCEVRLDSWKPDGFVELSVSKHEDVFFARLQADGTLALQHATLGTPRRESWASTRLSITAGEPVHLALSNVDYVVSIEVNGEAVLRSAEAHYAVTPERARALAEDQTPPRLRIAAGNVRAELAHLLIERDIYYTSDVRVGLDQQPGYGTMGHPLTLGPDQYYVLGDNSPSSLDCRFSFSQADRTRNVETPAVGPHLEAAYAQGSYQLGTVPADQLIGPAFLVYWPGTAELVPDQVLPRPLRLLNHLPTPGRIRWIH